MRWFRDIPIRLKLIVLMAGTSSLVLTIVSGLFVYRDVMLMRSEMLQQYKSMADLLGESSTAALSFNDRTTGQETLNLLRREPNVLCAAIFERSGSEFARYVHENAAFVPPEQPLNVEQGFVSSGDLVVVQPIVLDRTRLGYIYLRASPHRMNQRVRGDIAVAGAVLLAAILASVAISARLQRTISAPVDQLVEAARRVTDTSDYGVRVDLDRGDEFETLGHAFDRMLAEIESRDSELVTKNEMLSRAKHEMQQFVYTISHDLKSPLVTCKGFLGIMRQDVEEGRWEDMLDSVTRLERATGRLGALIEDLLELSRIGIIRNEPEEIDVGELVESIVADMRHRLDESGISCTIEDMPRVVADRVRLGEVFENLLSNAIKYGGGGGSPHIVIGGEQRNGEVRYFVQDNGPGIASEFHEKIFGLFQRLESDKDGTGVGLAAVARVMEIHGGQAGVDSTPGKGARFWISFPV